MPKAIANEGSRRISEKAGMRVVTTFERDLVCGRLPAELWEITAEEWCNRCCAVLNALANALGDEVFARAPVMVGPLVAALDGAKRYRSR